MKTGVTTVGVLLLMAAVAVTAAEPIKVGMIYPQTGPWHEEGLDHYRGAALAVEHINAAGGVLGQPIELVCGNSAADIAAVRAEVAQLIDRDHCRILVGGGDDDITQAIGDVCQQKAVPFFVTMGFSPDITGVNAHRHTFRECLDSYMAARAIGEYLRTNYAGKTFMYLTADNAGARGTETAIRLITSTEDRTRHKSLSAFGSEKDFSKHLALVRTVQPNVLVIVMDGEPMLSALAEADKMDLSRSMQLVVPQLTLSQAVALGPEVTEGVLCASPWYWNLAYQNETESSRRFVQDFAVRYVCYPGSGAAAAYTVLQQYRAGAEKTGSIETPRIVARMEGAAFELLKGPQTWRAFDHQSIQTVYAIRGKPARAVLEDMFNQDFFEVVGSVPGEKVVLSQAEWEAARLRVGLDASLEPLIQMAGQ